ncbi:MAG: sarcosine oxidase subunit gamma family protein [Gammaproteobacteria bacterium]|nr:MAG: sarcosine oxidase subunit gamma family protein [Gammaproteobacteria bacterium]TLZ25425.1 MAG: sarcosine oxidase subunit gamma family protein [Gammaproteobacteria bacterium]TLZ47107.1 MAG: sarcosine oxidase subunit gamma family protein [Gammaproteobacteria bacterium]
MRDLSAARCLPQVSASTVLHALPPATRYVLRGGSEVRAAAESALGCGIPARACRATVEGDRAALWLGPDEWLLIAPEPPPRRFAAALAEALAGLPHSLVDVSHRQSALALSGPQATTLLAAGCPLDLDLGPFPVDMCTRTMLAKAEVLLWRTGPQVFRVEVWRSFVAYVSQFLGEAARGIIQGREPK